MKTGDANDLTKEQLLNWIGKFCRDRRWALCFSLPPESISSVEQECDDYEQSLIACIESALNDQASNMKEILAEIVNFISDAWRADEFDELRAPVPGPVDENLFSKSGNEIPNTDFFNIIWKNPAYIGSVFALDKIAAWRRDMYSGDKRAADYAKDMLKKIGTTLARTFERAGSGTGYRETCPPILVKHIHHLIYQDLVDSGVKFTGESQFSDLKNYAKSLHIELDDSDADNISNDATDVFSNRNLAAYLVGKMLGLKTTGVTEYLT